MKSLKSRLLVISTVFEQLRALRLRMRLDYVESADEYFFMWNATTQSGMVATHVYSVSRGDEGLVLL